MLYDGETGGNPASGIVSHNLRLLRHERSGWCPYAVSVHAQMGVRQHPLNHSANGIRIFELNLFAGMGKEPLERVGEALPSAKASKQHHKLSKYWTTTGSGKPW